MLDWRWQNFRDLTTAQLYEILSARNAVFTVEQKIFYVDTDGKDVDCWHLCAYNDGKFVAYLRVILESDNAAVIGRILTVKEKRGQGFGRLIVNKAVELLREQWPERGIHLHAQAYLEPFYRALNFAPTSELHDVVGIPHQWMHYAFSPGCTPPASLENDSSNSNSSNSSNSKNSPAIESVARPNITWKWKTFQELSPMELYEIITVRYRVFVIEQNCLYLEVDGADTTALHLCGFDAANGNVLAAYLRVLEKLQLGRILVKKYCRKQGLCKELVGRAIKKLASGDYSQLEIKMEAQNYLREAYTKMGFQVNGEVFYLDGIPHVWMTYCCTIN